MRNKKFLSKLKKTLRNTLKSGESDDIKKNHLQVNKKKRLKHKKTKLLIERNKKKIVLVPACIDYYDHGNYNLTNRFLNKIKELVLSKQKILLNFDRTRKITASAMISFISEVSLLCELNKNEKYITFSHPKNEKMESILKQVGFYDLLNKPKRKTKEYDDVSYWNYASGINTDSKRLADNMDDLEKKLSELAQRKLYKGFTEAMANCVEHAYYATNEPTRWWAFSGIKNNKLIVVICDKGIGIPNSLPLTRTEEIIDKVKKILGLSKLNDSALIKIAAMMGRTRTEKGHRGKGLKDIKSIIDVLNEGSLTIHSNFGYYTYYRKNGHLNDKKKEQKTSVNGTIVEWAIPILVD
ncbi:ATP-binding protein [Morganella morganii]|uniref:ATP-binding protein n=1 Tax=Morganella morganii TaxID=582 RepID=UPI001BD5D852|nr:ATP-binding protein [Morganella morganii]MBS9585787.1 sensor histidine kinase [Morganella morganii subsp. morganii]QWL85574.1 sensor histidine kinase [Morganella morganii subsp. morganii]